MLPMGYTDMTTLLHCSQKYEYRQQGVPDQNRGMTLGTLMHDFLERWWTGRAWAAGAFSPEALALVEDDDIIDHAVWLADRYVSHYGQEPAFVSTVLVEQEVVDERRGLRGRIDRVVETEDGWWVVEDKTYGNRQRLQWLEADLQPVIYTMLARDVLGLDVRGVLWNGIYTMRWKPEVPTQAALIDEAKAAGRNFASKEDARRWAKEEQKHRAIERPLHESFDLRWLTPTPNQEDEVVYLRDWIDDRLTADHRPRWPQRNIGGHCTYCNFKARCFSEQKFGEDAAEIEVVDE